MTPESETNETLDTGMVSTLTVSQKLGHLVMELMLNIDILKLLSLLSAKSQRE